MWTKPNSVIGLSNYFSVESTGTVQVTAHTGLWGGLTDVAGTLITASGTHYIGSLALTTSSAVFESRGKFNLTSPTTAKPITYSFSFGTLRISGQLITPVNVTGTGTVRIISAGTITPTAPIAMRQGGNVTCQDGTIQSSVVMVSGGGGGVLEVGTSCAITGSVVQNTGVVVLRGTINSFTRTAGTLFVSGGFISGVLRQFGGVTNQVGGGISGTAYIDG